MPHDVDAAVEVPSPRALERRFDRLQALVEDRHRQFLSLRQKRKVVEEFLELAPKAGAVLDELSRTLFGEMLDEIEANLTHAIKEILGQERRVVSIRELKAGRLTIQFQIEREDGDIEDILRGQGGSVCNILSVGLRLIALSLLDRDMHRPFLVLDEQDCWLKPELVSRYMGVIKTVADKLGLQVLVISHHQIDHFSLRADRIYSLLPDWEKGVSVQVVKNSENSASAPIEG
ncbi:MAG: hypothetical protein ACNI3A_05050 [Desulfovibrio sp.]|uniref:hypothetical protein n=1 Tax=Desulfovibrio sp. 7SRBS1 TaxID=3378064 RepID=UPI003B411E73